MNGFIYIITNTINGKVYIGQTITSIEQRWKEHCRRAKYSKYLINRAMNKYGVENFTIDTLEQCDRSILDEREIYYIHLYNSTDKSIGYNVSLGGKTPKFEKRGLPEKTVLSLYLKGETLTNIAKMYNVTRYTITSIIKNNNIAIKKSQEYRQKFDTISKEVLENALMNTTSLRKAAKYANIPYPTFRKACIYNNIEYNLPTSTQQSL